jgi:hypothetical protein
MDGRAHPSDLRQTYGEERLWSAKMIRALFSTSCDVADQMVFMV